MPLLELENVYCAYDGQPALNGISLNIEKGDAVALLGQNGCGKSTLLKLACGAVTAGQGLYRFDGQEINASFLRSRKAALFHSRINLVFQNPDAMLFCASVYEEIAYGPRRLGLTEHETHARVNDCLEMLGIMDLKHREPFHLSEGEKRRVAIAAVLAMNPDVLALDEPMDGLDPRTKRFLRGLLLELRRAGKTIICATHEFGYIEGVFERAVVFNARHGIERDGPYQEIMNDQPFLERMNLA